MITFKGTDGDIIKIEHAEELTLAWDRIENRHCLVTNCLYGDHLYGYNFCSLHQWILPIASHEISFGFQVALINYWKKQGKKIIQTHRYVEK